MSQKSVRVFRSCFRAVALLLLTSVILLVESERGTVRAGPFADQYTFTQPDGTRIVLWGEGDDFSAVFETLDGYTVMFDPKSKAYFYARLNAAADELVSTGVQVGLGDPSQLGLALHLRLNPVVAKAQAAARYQQWDQALEISQRWQELKNARHAAETATLTASAPKTVATLSVGTRIGLCLLADFSDDVATMPSTEIFNFCNADFYEDYGNNGSVKMYFKYNSNGLLTYSNIVAGYVRLPRPKSYYNDTSQSCFFQGNLVVRDAIAALRALPNYTTQILPTFGPLSVDSSNRVLALNLFFAGENSGVWAYGLWPHCGGLTNVGAQELSAGGKKVFRYEMTQIGSRLEMGLFCHENGHLLFGYPDIYDFGFDSVGGAGLFCIMNSGWRGPNPTQICAYLKYMAGWASITELNSASSLTATVTAPYGTNFNHFYRYAKPGVPTEYFIVENRRQAGRDANIASSGVAIWHVDELGNRDNQSLVPNTNHANYEVTLVQADNRWDFENNVNIGDPNDLYYNGNPAAGYSNAFSDFTSPSASWWDGSRSGINFHDFSASGDTMTFVVEPASAIAPSLMASSSISGNTFRVTLRGAAGARYQIESSTNLKDWGAFLTITNTTGQISFSESNISSVQHKFFRARLGP